jgi:hypothetical protein
MALLKNLSIAPLGAVFIALGTVDAAQAATIYGDSQQLGDGFVRTFVTLDDEGNPLDIGITLTAEVLSNLPSEQERYAYEVSFPEEASATAFNHMVFHWNPHGHEPGPFLVPHFDFGFSRISREERQAIVPTSDDWNKVYKLPSPEFSPAGYVPGPTGGAEPTLGNFWVDPTSPAFQGEPLTEVFLYASYDGEIVLDAISTTPAFLETKPNLTRTLKIPAAYSKSGYNPTEYSVTYDATSQEYRMALSGMTFRSATPTSVPELSPTWGFLALGVWGTASHLKNKLQKQKLTSR